MDVGRQHCAILAHSSLEAPMSRRVNRIAPASAEHVQAGSTSNAAAVPVASVSRAGGTEMAPRGPSAPGASGDGWTLHRGRWEDTMADCRPDALIFDAPFSAGTHDADTTRADGSDAAGLTPDYEPFGLEQIRTFCEHWAPRCPDGWWVSMTDSELHPVWRDEMAAVGRYAFRAPVPCVIRGMSVRIQNDGPSSWTVYLAVSRPRSKAFAQWGVLDGAYVGGSGTNGRAGGSSRGGGRGKPQWLMQAIVRDYSRPGDVIVDPFAGWGSTLAAAVSLGRAAVGAEMDAAAYAEAVRRLRRPLQVDLLSGVGA